MHDTLRRVRSRGHWTVVIRPAAFRQNRVDAITSLLPLLQRAVLQLRGWDFPHIDSRMPPRIDLDWIWQSFDWDIHKGLWRLYQSGQFFYCFSMPLDWRDESIWWPADEGWKPGVLMGIGDAIFQFVEIMEFASRLALSDAGDDNMHISVEVGSLAGRVLYMDSHRARWPLDFTYKASMDTFPHVINVSRSKLVAEHRTLAYAAAIELFRRFGWNPSYELMQDWYQKRG